ncbi:MAG: hypothetical protein EHM42_08455 [Planctomycetaceae bacterium]|nr:MAG: hypothetical protein EHM42_08455 [Planctomycetaceae bacterium]
MTASICLFAALNVLISPALYADDVTTAKASRPRPLLVAFSSLRDRPAFASLFLYRPVQPASSAASSDSGSEFPRGGF